MMPCLAVESEEAISAGDTMKDRKNNSKKHKHGGSRLAWIAGASASGTYYQY